MEGWYEIPDSMIENNTFSPFVEFFIRIYFVTILFVGGIFGLSLVNSIFVDSMISDNNNPLEEKIENLNKKVDELTEIIKNKS
ncbi:MAG: hypothetical protein JJU02_00295 [Cryomorphaceae bacterium]|nr:hypothetical protein [Cryomorphaceae bacterium]